MGQQEVLKAIEEFEIATFGDLRNHLKLTDRAITHALSQLKKWKEVDFVIFREKTIYFKENFFNQLENETETMDQI